MTGMTADETGSYIRHHLQHSGRDGDLFSDDAIGQIHEASRGKPRTVNNICVAALIATYVTGKRSSTSPPPAPPSARSYQQNEHPRDTMNTKPRPAIARRGLSCRAYAHRRRRHPAHAERRGTQHLDVRLTAEDGYTAEREYSIASAPGEPVAITVERLEDGEVSPYLTGELRAGDELELRGPVGGYFVWEPGDDGPLMLLAGGSGIVPLRSILRHRLRTGSDVPARLLYSSRSWEDVIYRDELGQDHDGVQVSYTLTRGHPAGWTGHTGRIDSALLAGVAWPAAANPMAYICGPTTFVETAAAEPVGLGYRPERVKTERFGSTGGR